MRIYSLELVTPQQALDGAPPLPKPCLFLYLTITYASIPPYIHNTQHEREKKTKNEGNETAKDDDLKFIQRT